MTPSVRAAVVKRLEAGQSNAVIARALGVTVNQVGGVRYRDFGSVVSAAEARALPKDHVPCERAARARSAATRAAVLAAVPHAWARPAEIIATFGTRNCRHTVLGYLIDLWAAGEIERRGETAALRYRRRAT